MLKSHCKLLSAVLFTLTTASAFAAEENAGIIHFTGELVSPSCVIVGDNGPDSTIPLGTYPTSLFTKGGVGTESTKVPFTITLKDCPLATDGLPAVQLTFSGQTTLSSDPTLLDISSITTTGVAATGVGIAVSTATESSTLLTMDNAENQVSIDLVTNPTDTIKADFLARYISFSETVTAGAADADMTVSIVYH